MLQKLKLMFNLELISIQRNITYLAAQAQAQQQAAQQPGVQALEAANAAATPAKPSAAAPATPALSASPGTGADAAATASATSGADASAPGAPGGAPTPAVAAAPATATAGAGGAASANAAASPAAASMAATPATASPAPKQAHHHHHHRGAGGGAGMEPANMRLLWARRQDEITQLLATVTALHDSLKQLCRRDDPGGEEVSRTGREPRQRVECFLAQRLGRLVTALLRGRTRGCCDVVMRCCLCGAFFAHHRLTPLPLFPLDVGTSGDFILRSPELLRPATAFRPPARQDAAGGPSRADRAATYEAVLDFILSTLITPRTVSAILHAAKKLVSASVTGSAALAAGGAPPELPPADSDSQHGLALLSTALRAVETCLQVRRSGVGWRERTAPSAAGGYHRCFGYEDAAEVAFFCVQNS